MAQSDSITVKNPLFAELPKITISIKSGKTTYRFTGLYDGNRSLPAKLLKMMANNSAEESDKNTNV